MELSLDLPDAAHLPATYVEAEDVRLEAYRRLTAVRTVEQIADVRTEWEDRFGPLPGPAAALLDVARLRVECLRLGITDIAVSVPRGGWARWAADRRPGRGQDVADHPACLRGGPAPPAGPGCHLPSRPAPAAGPDGRPAGGSEYAPGLVQLLTELVPADD